VAEFDPEVFGKYYLVDKIAVGGMAEIFKAKTFSHGGFEKLLVIKRILSHLSENEDFVSMFIDEAKISVSLQHANIVQIYDFGKIHSNYFIAMEWIDGKDVKQILRKLASRRKLLPEEFAVHVAHEASKALDFAHRKADLQGKPMGIVHRDVSPSNVLVSYDGEIKIADFGIAKAQLSAYNTKDGVLKGKFEYMSPEQARGENLTQQSDIFSAGIILYEMLTGRRLFTTDSEIKTLEKVRAVDIAPPSAVNPNIPPRLDAIVMRALQKNAGDRFRDAGEFQAALLEYMYPSTPTVTQKSLGLFMKQLFAEERALELTRLERGSEVARDLHSKVPDLYLDEGWETNAGGRTNPTNSGGTGASALTLEQAPRPSRAPLVIAGVAALLLLSLAGWFLSRGEVQPEPAPPPPQITTATVRFDLDPPGAWVMRLDEGGAEERLGVGPKLSLTLEEGDYELRVEADDHLPEDILVSLAAGERVVLPVRLREAPREEEVDEAREDDGAGRDGAGREAEDARRDEPPEPPPEERAPPPPANGKINVNVTRGWAHVYVDGVKLPETTPLTGYTLPAGAHVVRVVNEASGLDQSQTVTVNADGTAKVVFEGG